MIPQSGLFFSPLRIPLNKRFDWDWVLYFVFHLLEDSRKGWKAEARVYNTPFIFLLSSKPVNPSSRTPGLRFKSQPLPSQSVGRRRKRSWRVGPSFPWRPAGAPRLAGCPQSCAPIPLASAPRTPRFPARGKPRAPRRPSGHPPPQPPAAGLSGGAAELPRTPGPQVAPGLRAGHARPSGGSWIPRGPKRREWRREKRVSPRCRGPTQTESRDGGRTRALALAWLWLGRCGLCSGAAPNSSPKGPGNSRESGAQPRVWGGGAEGERVGRGGGRESGMLPAPLSTLAPGREDRTQRAAR